MKKKSKKTKGKSYKIMKWVAIAIFVLSILIFTYPFTNYFFISMKNQELINTFEEEKVKEKKSNDYEKLLKEMKAYNASLISKGQYKIYSSFEYESFPLDIAKYNLPNNIVAYVDIPSISFRMPLYLGASKKNLDSGGAIMGYSSAPIGGKNTNCVIAGHNYWAGSVRFKKIASLNKGDKVEITNLWEKLEYKVIDKKIIGANQFDDMFIKKDKDLITIFTCYYSAGKQERYLVTCERSN